MPGVNPVSINAKGYTASTGPLALGKAANCRVVLKNNGNGTVYVYRATFSQDGATPLNFKRSNSPTNPPSSVASPSPMRVGDTTPAMAQMTYDATAQANVLTPDANIGGFIPANGVVKQIDLQPTILGPGQSFGYTVVIPASLSNSITTLLGTVSSVTAIITLFWWEE